MIEVGHKQKIFYTDDTCPMCPHCGSKKSTVFAQAHVNGASQDLRKCEDCMAVFSKVDGCLHEVTQQISSSMQGQTLGSSVGITTWSGSTSGSLSGSGGWHSGQQVQQYLTPITANIDTYALENALKNSLGSKIDSLGWKFDSMINELRNIVQENQKLQERLATDPLIGIKDKINNFNLE